MKILSDNAIVKPFHDTQVQVVAMNGEAWMTMESIGAALEYPEPLKQVSKMYKRHEDEIQEYSTIVSLGTVEAGIEKNRDFRVFNQKGVMLITMFSRQPKAKEFRRWAVDVLDSYRKGQLAVQSPEPPAYDKQLTDMVALAGKGNAYAQQLLKDRWGVATSDLKEVCSRVFATCPCCDNSFELTPGVTVHDKLAIH